MMQKKTELMEWQTYSWKKSLQKKDVTSPKADLYN